MKALWPSVPIKVPVNSLSQPYDSESMWLHRRGWAAVQPQLATSLNQGRANRSHGPICCVLHSWFLFLIPKMHSYHSWRWHRIFLSWPNWPWCEGSWQVVCTPFLSLGWQPVAWGHQRPIFTFIFATTVRLSYNCFDFKGMWRSWSMTF